LTIVLKLSILLKRINGIMIFRTPRIPPGDGRIIARLDEIRRGLGRALQTPQRWTSLLRRNMIARAIQGSNTIEGYNVTFEDAVALMEGEEPEATQETLRALEGYRHALTYILRLSDDQHTRLNAELVRSLHYMMLSHDSSKHPGQWRPGMVFVRREPSGGIVYEGADASLVPELMEELFASLSEPSSIPVVVRAAMAHLNLVMIHPFSDGNGRMARAIQTLILARDGITSPTFSSIEEYLGSRGNTDAYYRILAEVGSPRWRPEGDAAPWVQFCLKAHLQQALTVERRTKEIARLWDELEVEIARAGLHGRMIFALYDAAIGFRVQSSRYRVHAEVSAQIASRDLRALVQAGLLVPKGEKKGRVYLASEALGAIRERTRQPRVDASEVLKQLSLPL
jgi:Fic family protein